MRRRAVLIRSAAAAAAAMAIPWASGRGADDKSAVRYPDPAVVTLDPKWCQARISPILRVCSFLVAEARYGKF